MRDSLSDNSPGEIASAPSEVDMSGPEYDYNYSSTDEILVNRKRYKKGEICNFFGRPLQLTEFLGRGGFGSAWLVEDTDTQEKFVLKVAHKHSDSFEKSLSLTQDKDIPTNVQRILAYDRENRLVLLNYIEGNRALRTRIYLDAETGAETEFKTEQRLIIAWSILRKMLQTWAKLAKLGLVHGDTGTKHFLSSGGLIDPDILDTVGHPQKLNAVGTPLFIAPERCLGLSYHTTDLCSIGISLALYLEGDRVAVSGDGIPKSKPIESQIEAKRKEIRSPVIPDNSEVGFKVEQRGQHGFAYNWGLLKTTLKLGIDLAPDLGPGAKRFFHKLIDRICDTLEAITRLVPRNRPQTEEAVCELMGVKPLAEEQRRVTPPKE